MNLLENKSYMKLLHRAVSQIQDWEKLQNSSIMITGATGMIGSFLIDMLMYKNQHDQLGCKLYALGRNLEKGEKRFGTYFNNPLFEFIVCNINSNEFKLNVPQVDYLFHAASNTHPLAYSNDPIGTVTANIMGTHNLLKYATTHGTKRFLFASSVEIYGENRGDIDAFNEAYCGYIDCNTLRAGYPESKRAGEALCQAYISQEGLDIVIPRLARSYGPTMLMSDTKAVSQFIKNGVAKENIILKSEGTQLYSYTFMVDAVIGILYCLFRGQNGVAYNIVGEGSDITLRELAKMIALHTGTKVLFGLPNEAERAGYSKATKAIMDGARIAQLGWKPLFDIESGIALTLKILRNRK